MLDSIQSKQLHHSFHMFWDNFPFPVLLIQEDRTILAINSTAKEAGYVLGQRCLSHGSKKLHKGCKANIALRERIAQRSVEYVEEFDSVMDVYWIPLMKHENVYIHFGIDISEYAAEKLFPSQLTNQKERHACDCSFQ